MIYVIAVILSILLFSITLLFERKYSEGKKIKKINLALLIILIFLILFRSLRIASIVSSFGDGYFYEKIEIKPIEKENTKIVYLEKAENKDNAYKYINSKGEEELIYTKNIKSITSVKGEKAFIEIFRKDQKYNIWTFGYGPIAHKYEYYIYLPTN